MLDNCGAGVRACGGGPNRPARAQLWGGGAPPCTRRHGGEQAAATVLPRPQRPGARRGAGCEGSRRGGMPPDLAPARTLSCPLPRSARFFERARLPSTRIAAGMRRSWSSALPPLTVVHPPPTYRCLRMILGPRKHGGPVNARVKIPQAQRIPVHRSAAK